MTETISSLVQSFGLQGRQWDAVVARGYDVAVTAGAGSGKTRTLVARYLSLLDEGLLPRQIVAVTFTEKAAREMRNRIRRGIADWLASGCPAAERGRWDEIEADVDAAPIGTIHSLCASLLRAHCAEAGIDPLVAVLDEGLCAALKAEAVEDTLGWATAQADLATLFAAFNVDELRAVLADLLAARLDAPPALGASDVLERWHRAILAESDCYVHSDEVSAAIADLDGLRATGRLDDDAGDKLAAQVRALLAQWQEVQQALQSGDALAAAQSLRLLRGHFDGRAGRKGSLAKDVVKKLREHYGKGVAHWLGAAGTLPDEAESRAAELVGPLARLFERANQAYQRAKDLRQAVDFDDLEWHAARLLQDPEIRARWQRQIRALLVDEFQDTNQRQRQIVEALAGSADGLTGRLFVVGDAKQSIYRFRGADVAVFRGLAAAIRARGGQLIPLDVTFRAHDPLVKALNEILGRAMGEEDDASRPYAVPFSPLTADRPLPRAGIAEPYVEFLCGQSDSAEEARPIAAELLARRLRELRDREGVQWHEMALLFRAAAGFPDYEAALEAAGIPFVTVAGKGFYDRPEIRDMLNMLRALVDPTDDLALAGMLSSPAFGLGQAALYRLRWPAGDPSPAAPLPFRIALRDNLAGLSERDRRLAERARAIVEGLSGLVDRVTVAELIKLLLDATLYPAMLQSVRPGPRLQRNVDKLLADAGASGLVRVAEFLRYVETLSEAGAREGEAPAEAGGAVRLMTVHKAKGLEFPVVVIADASRVRPAVSGPALLSSQLGLVPSPERFEAKPLAYGLAKALDRAQSDAEDTRALYVAATRAREKLLICGHRAKREVDCWFTQLAGAAGLQLDAAILEEAERRVISLSASGQQVSFAVASSRQLVDPVEEPAGAAAPEPTAGLAPLYGPVLVLHVTQVEDRLDRDALHLHRIGGRPFTEGKLVGKLVHEAIRRWRFPGDHGLERLLRAAAFTFGLVDPCAVDEHVGKALALLGRLRDDPLWPVLDAAERHHELPFSILRDQTASSGAIDLLYRPVGGEQGGWHIVDFKSDHVADPAELPPLVEEYRAQIRRYRNAASRALGGRVGTALCFLDFCSGVRWEPVD